MLVLGIETSCDDTAVALVNSDRKIIFNKVIRKLEEHQMFGGVVPEIASRNHLATLPFMFDDLEDYLPKIDAVAITHGPGLIGGLIVGVMYAKSLAYALGLPIIPVNHLEGHILTNRLIYKELEFPFLSLLVSGGHCQFILAHSVGNYEVIGSTLDDAVGEAFDKVGKMLGLEYPGGPKVEKFANLGDADAFSFPKPMIKDKATCNLSFSGLKTAVKRSVDAFTRENGSVTQRDIANFCASFQSTVSEILCEKLKIALKIASDKGIRNFTICGGVSANQFICDRLRQLTDEFGFNFFNAPIDLCTDNAAMIAWCGLENWKLKKFSKNAFQNFNFAPQSTLKF